MKDLLRLIKRGVSPTTAGEAVLNKMTKDIFGEDLLDIICLENDIFKNKAEESYGIGDPKFLTDKQIAYVRNETKSQIARIRRTFPLKS